MFYKAMSRIRSLFTLQWFKTNIVHILDREEKWFEWEVKEATDGKHEKPILNWGGDLRFHLSNTRSATLIHFPKQFFSNSHRGTCGQNNSQGIVEVIFGLSDNIDPNIELCGERGLWLPKAPLVPY